ncbi:hypothetical protein [Acinetobacter calcoaceticus]|uniref:hypothetical protein n=1 Tax=Acinetobacter calcoaceticus TaxID=471 RepID=UPI00124F2E69|nr:hypothetical protein [Acinetobacter calcoaceticus]
MKILNVLLSTVVMASMVGCVSQKPTRAPSSFASAPVNQPDTVKNYMQSISIYQQSQDLSVETERKIQRLTDNYIKTKMIVDEAVKRGNAQAQSN